ncbi:MAG TPA: hypothetical protein VGR78_12595 [Verrucomicrobiae bacterium]|jgi:hypothetical protein|nr:hypothetical protein [Verrucomicrobiae bacterium]
MPTPNISGIFPTRPRWRGLAGAGAGWKLHWLLSIGVFMEFVGHGACGVATKAAWLPFFRVFALPDSLSWKLMPVVGSWDITLGVMALLSPRRALYFYMAAWGCFTALLRPAAGQGWWEFIERSYNYGVPFALLFLHGFGTDRKSWFAALRTVPKTPSERMRTLLWLLRIVVALMLIGHGGFGPFMEKQNLLGLYQATGLGVFGLSLETIRAALGFFEIALGAFALFAGRPDFFIGVCAWKIMEESLYLVAGAPLACWEVVERGGSYAAPLAIVLAWQVLSSSGNSTEGSILLQKGLTSQ